MCHFLSLLTVVVLLSFQVVAGEFKASGVGSFGVISYLRPSGLQNQTAFSMEQMQLDLKFLPNENKFVQLSIEGAERRTNTTTGPFLALTKFFYYQQNEFLFDSVYFRMGQIPTPWIMEENDLWGYRFLGVSHNHGLTFLERYGYESIADLGVGFGGYHGWLKWDVAVTNGETYEAPETGMHKDYLLHLSIRPFAVSETILKNFFISGYMVSGRYENYSVDLSGRTRNLAILGYHQPKRFTLYGLSYKGQDPADRVHNRVALGANLLSRGGEVSTSQGSSVVSRFNFGVFSEKVDYLELFARVDKLDPDSELTTNSLSFQLLGLSYRFNENLMLAYANAWTKFEVNHGAGDDEQVHLLQSEIRF